MSANFFGLDSVILQTTTSLVGGIMPSINIMQKLNKMTYGLISTKHS